MERLPHNIAPLSGNVFFGDLISFCLLNGLSRYVVKPVATSYESGNGPFCFPFARLCIGRRRIAVKILPISLNFMNCCVFCYPAQTFDYKIEMF